MDKSVNLLHTHLGISGLPVQVQDISKPTQKNLIQKTSGVCGGNARIRDTRIAVWTLVSFHKQGSPDEELLRNYPALTQQDLEAAWSYYGENPEEIDSVIADDIK